MKRTSRVLVSGVIAGICALAAGVGAQEAPERWRGRIAALGGPLGGQSAYLTLQADAWTGDETIADLASVLIDDGGEALLKKVAALPSVGWVTVGAGLRYEMRTMRSFDLPDGGRLIRAVTDRPIQIGEITRPSRSRKYGFGMIELYLTADGTGEGRVIPAAQIEIEDGQVEITSFGTQPFVLVKVVPQKVKG